MQSSMSFVSPRKDFSGGQLKLIRRTVARDCTEIEFDEFIAVAAHAELDPLRRQISPLILNPDDAQRRRMVPWATIDGLRVIAARSGDYRPMETAPLIEREEKQIDPMRNPLGIVRAEVRAWKCSAGAWHPVAGEAWWDEHAPLRPDRGEVADGPEANGAMRLEPSWMRMGRVMIAKCAEAQALRRGWPDVLSGLYSEEELHSVRAADQTASERVKAHQDGVDRLRTAHAGSLWLVFDPLKPIESVARADVGDRIKAFYAQASAADITGFQTRNKQSLALFWEYSAAQAFELKSLAEAKLSAPPRAVRSRRKRAKRSASSDEGAST